MTASRQVPALFADRVRILADAGLTEDALDVLDLHLARNPSDGAAFLLQEELQQRVAGGWPYFRRRLRRLLWSGPGKAFMLAAVLAITAAGAFLPNGLAPAVGWIAAIVLSLLLRLATPATPAHVRRPPGSGAGTGRRLGGLTLLLVLFFFTFILFMAGVFSMGDDGGAANWAILVGAGLLSLAILAGITAILVGMARGDAYAGPGGCRCEKDALISEPRATKYAKRHLELVSDDGLLAELACPTTGARWIRYPVRAGQGSAPVRLFRLPQA